MEVLQKEIMICLGIAIDVGLLAHCISSTSPLLLHLCLLAGPRAWIGRLALSSSSAEKSCRFNLHTLRTAFTSPAAAVLKQFLIPCTQCFCRLQVQIYLAEICTGQTHNPEASRCSLGERREAQSWKWNCCKYVG